MAIRFNIRMAGVGGQGVVTGSHIFSTGVINAGGESTIVPEVQIKTDGFPVARA